MHDFPPPFVQILHAPWPRYVSFITIQTKAMQVSEAAAASELCNHEHRLKRQFELLLPDRTLTGCLDVRTKERYTCCDCFHGIS